jgi:hypothetical protein
MSDWTLRQIQSDQRRIGQTEVREVPFTDIGASVYRTTNFTLPSGVNTFIQFDSEEWDTASLHDNVTNNTRLTVPYAGKYLCEACVQMAAGAAAGTFRYIYFQRNGLTNTGNQKGLIYMQVARNDAAILVSSAIFNLSAGDYIELGANQDTGGNINISAASYSPFFQIHRLP